eukprot:TRINITY_DN8203_c0_g2_i1.p1 TRINITY_DN8203_c0_g2~~TRINITY_DN8203_c0_g2_i1.p1  ORF type:complete len:146 (+),score=1.83 TRINITY_DN8203_c0_g2_i1:694-1131(+)
MVGTKEVITKRITTTTEHASTKHPHPTEGIAPLCLRLSLLPSLALLPRSRCTRHQRPPNHCDHRTSHRRLQTCRRMGLDHRRIACRLLKDSCWVSTPKDVMRICETTGRVPIETSPTAEMEVLPSRGRRRGSWFILAVSVIMAAF